MESGRRELQYKISSLVCRDREGKGLWLRDRDW
jgi:hypothetical protein